MLIYNQNAISKSTVLPYNYTSTVYLFIVKIYCPFVMVWVIRKLKLSMILIFISVISYHFFIHLISKTLIH